MANLLNSTVDDLIVSGASNLSNQFTRPNLPIAVLSKNDGGACYGTTGPVPFNTVEIANNITLTNSNSRITVPEDGRYFVLFWTIGHNNCGSTGRLYIYKNGARVTGQARTDVGIRYGNCYCFAVADAVAGDYFEANQTAGFLYFNSAVYNKFVIYKIV